MERFKFTDKAIREYALSEGVSRREIWDEEIKHLCCRVSNTGKKVFQVIGKLHGKTTRVSLGDFPALGATEARAKARKALVALTDGININDQKKQKRVEARENPTTIKAVYDRMLEVKPRTKHTLYSYKASMNHMVSWHNLPVAKLTRQMVLTRYTEIKTKIGPYAANRFADLLSAICNHSRIVSGKPEANPVTVIRDTGSRFKEASRDVSLSNDEVRLFLAVIDGLKGGNTRDIMLTILYTGMRKSEAMGLQWENINLQDKTLYIPKTKNGKPLLLPLPSVLVDMMNARWELWQHPDRGAVFPTSSTDGHAKSLDQASRHIKLEIPHFTPHVLRKTFTTIAADIGIEDMVIDKLTNHIPRGMTAKHYYKPNVESLREPMQRIADRITELSKA